MTTVDNVPSKLPVSTLSVSSLKLLQDCPEKWKRRYIDRHFEPPNGKMILGSSVGAAEAQHYGQVIETGEGMSLEQVQDEFSAEWDDRTTREEVVWGDDKPGVLKDQGAVVLDRYHSTVAPTVVPATVERKFEVQWAGLDWSLIGFMDVETADGAVVDLKVRGRKLSPGEAHKDLQASAYLFARRAELNPASTFAFHTMVRGSRPTVEVVPTSRTDRQLDTFADRVLTAAAEIEWRAENDHWTGAPPSSWMCSARFCGFWNSCKFGGLR